MMMRTGRDLYTITGDWFREIEAVCGACGKGHRIGSRRMGVLEVFEEESFDLG